MFADPLTPPTSRPPASAQFNNLKYAAVNLLFLGDYVDRGPYGRASRSPVTEGRLDDMEWRKTKEIH